MKPLENHMVIGDYYPRREKAEPDPDEQLDLARYWNAVEGFINPLFAGTKCPHACTGCTCRTDPRQLTLPFGEVVNL